MLYLIRSWGNGKSILKIGYTGNVQKRMENYYHSNPFFEKISIREGSEKEEKKLHLYLELLGYKYKVLDEWFLDIPEVLLKFHERIEKINKVLWKNRGKIWKKEDFDNKLMRRIFEEFWITWTPKEIISGTIDWEYKIMLSKELNQKIELDYDIW